MLLVVLALFWVALLSPIVIRRLRDGGTEKSILSFHAEHEVLSRQDYAVVPAHRLDQPDGPTRSAPVAQRKPRLTVVHADDTFGSLESRSSWEEWNDDYDYDDDERANAVNTNRYAQAYSSRPSRPTLEARYETPIRRRSMRAQRRVLFTWLVIIAVLVTTVAFLVNYPILFDVAAVAWFAVVGFVALAFYSVSQGYLNDSSLPIRLPQRRPLATIEPLYLDDGERYAPRYEDDFESEYYDASADDQWRREPQPRRAFG